MIDGVGGSPGKVTRTANIYNGASGEMIGKLPGQNLLKDTYALYGFDTTGSLLSFHSRAKDDSSLLLELPSRAILRQFESFPSCLGPHARRWLGTPNSTADQTGAFILFEQDQEKPLVKFVLDVGAATFNFNPQFSPDGLHLVWGNPDGAVTVVDLVETQRRLSELGLGW